MGTDEEVRRRAHPFLVTRDMHVELRSPSLADAPLVRVARTEMSALDVSSWRDVDALKLP